MWMPGDVEAPSLSQWLIVVFFSPLLIIEHKKLDSNPSMMVKLPWKRYPSMAIQSCRPVDYRWNCNIPIMHAIPVWDEALVKHHVHELIKHPPPSLSQRLIVVFFSPLPIIQHKKPDSNPSMMVKSPWKRYPSMATHKLPFNFRMHTNQLDIYLGQLPVHASTVALVLNPMTGRVSTVSRCVQRQFFHDR
jgi:hypothetical protein